MKTLYIHPDNPQSRLIDEVVTAIKLGKIAIIPTENGYRFAFGVHAKEAFDSIKRLGVDETNLVLICQNISQLSKMAVVNDDVFYVLKSDFLPHHVFVLEATKAINKKIITKKSLAFGTSCTPVVAMLLERLGEAIFTAPLIYQGEQIGEHYEIADKFDTQADVFIDVGVVDEVGVVVVDLTA